jgi:hypothetical protein
MAEWKRRTMNGPIDADAHTLGRCIHSLISTKTRTYTHVNVPKKVEKEQEQEQDEEARTHT